MDEKRRVLSLGAHPDDADTYPCALLTKLRAAGWEVRLLSLTDGSAGSTDMTLSLDALADIRRKEAARSGALFGGRYDVWDNRDGMLTPSLENRLALIRYIRDFRPDVILVNRPNDYHPDHRAASLLVQDASFMLTVPRVCPEARGLEHTPTILFWEDDFRAPYPFRADILVPAGEAHIDALTRVASCHESQYFDWLNWPDHTERTAWPREKQVEALRERFRRGMARARDRRGEALVERYGEADAARVRYLEAFEISEYGEPPTEAFLRVATAIPEEQQVNESWTLKNE